MSMEVDSYDRSTAQLGAELRQLTQNLMLHKQQGVAQMQLKETAGVGYALLLEMRAAEESLLQELSAASQAAKAAKERIDETDSELNILQYQKSKLLSGIACCQSAGQHLQLPEGLITLEESLGNRPASVQPRDTHEETLLRLAAECDERKRLCDALATAADTKRSRADELKARRQELAMVDSQLESFLSAAEALQSDFLPQPKVEASPEAAALPTPLHTLWSSASALVKAWESAAEVRVVRADSAVDVDSYAPAPWRVELVNRVESASSLRFCYLPQLELIGVCASTEELQKGLLSLVPGDDGSSFPDERSLLKALSAHGVPPSVEVASLPPPDVRLMLPLRPYRWAQWLGGIGPSLTDRPSSQPSFNSVLQSLLKLLGAPARF
mmetsp:Transcript_26115/g.54845  ORF Transcript_26115/g.54845 Transcript_26115/m.54845 type:complete len:385 (-) Transcript_26115:280-1434(-)